MPPQIQSPLKYPGSKWNLEDKILRFAPEFTEFREPFLGSGALSLRVAQTHPGARIRGRDLHQDLITFWKVLRLDPEALVARVREFHDAGLDHKSLEGEIRARLLSSKSSVETAALYFVANRSSWNGAGIEKGFLRQAHDENFSPGSIDRLFQAAPIARRIEIVKGEYAELFHAPGEGVFIYADPPYQGAIEGNLYPGLHRLFDHNRFLREATRCPHNLLISLDEHPLNRERFDGAKWDIRELPVINRSKGNEETHELLIANYDLDATTAANALAARGSEALFDLLGRE